MTFWQPGLPKDCGCICLWSQWWCSCLFAHLSKMGPEALGTVSCQHHHHNQPMPTKAPTLAPPHVVFSHSHWGFKFRVLLKPWQAVGKVMNSWAPCPSETYWLDLAFIFPMSGTVKRETDSNLKAKFLNLKYYVRLCIFSKSLSETW